MNNNNHRAWDKKKKYMFYAGSLSGVGDFYQAHIERGHEGEELYNCFSSVWYDWMKDTGLKDCKGKDIFEGDIVEWTIFPEKQPEGFRIKDVVAFSGGCFKVRKRCEILGLKEPHRQLTVIGNIYENPELLK